MNIERLLWCEAGEEGGGYELTPGGGDQDTGNVDVALCLALNGGLWAEQPGVNLRKRSFRQGPCIARRAVLDLLRASEVELCAVS